MSVSNFGVKYCSTLSATGASRRGSWLLTGTSCDPINKNEGSSSVIGFNMKVQVDLRKTLPTALLASAITYADASHMTCQYDGNRVKSIEEEDYHLSYKLVVRVFYRELVSVV
jgi:hypothetical protein